MSTVRPTRLNSATRRVEAKNFADRTATTAPQSGAVFQGSTDALHLVERFTRTGPNTIQYHYTITDPKTWTRSWSAEAPIPRVEPSLIYEFACHEQNSGLINVVTGTQISEGSRKAR